MREYELKLSSGKIVTWSGANGEDAARRYVETHTSDKVIAWRNANLHGVFQVNTERLIINE